MALVVGAVVGLVVGAAGFLALAPADARTTGPDGGSESSGATVTTSPGSGATEGDAGAAQASTPEEQAVHDLFVAIREGDCAGVIAVSRASYWDELFGVGEEDAARSACDATFAAGQGSGATVRSTSILQGDAEQAVVAAEVVGWHENEFRVRYEGDRWLVAYSSRALEGPTGGGDEGSESGGFAGAFDNPSGRPLIEPSDPPTGNATFDQLAENCHDGNMVACDDLYWVAPRSSDHELYGTSCGDRRLGVFAGGHCERDFNRMLDG